MNTLVIDSSVIVKWLNQDNESYIEKADKILQDVQKGNTEIIAPELAKYEVGNILLRGKKLQLKEANNSLKTLYLIPLTFIPESDRLANQTYAIAEKLGITYYDAAFLSVAKDQNATLITDNIKHQGKTKDIKVLPLREY